MPVLIELISLTRNFVVHLYVRVHLYVHRRYDMWTSRLYFYPFCVGLPTSDNCKTFLVGLERLLEYILVHKFHECKFNSLNLTKMEKNIPMLSIYPILCLIVVILCKLMKSSLTKAE